MCTIKELLECFHCETGLHINIKCTVVFLIFHIYLKKYMVKNVIKFTV